MEWIIVAEGIVILAFLLVLLLRKTEKPEEALQRAAAEIVRELRREIDAQFQQSRVESTRISSILRPGDAAEFCGFPPRHRARSGETFARRRSSTGAPRTSAWITF